MCQDACPYLCLAIDFQASPLLHVLLKSLFPTPYPLPSHSLRLDGNYQVLKWVMIIGTTLHGVTHFLQAMLLTAFFIGGSDSVLSQWVD